MHGATACIEASEQVIPASAPGIHQDCREQMLQVEVGKLVPVLFSYQARWVSCLSASKLRLTFIYLPRLPLLL
jgi:hypothetical protein